MKDLKVGQQIYTGYDGKHQIPLYETVYSFGHHDKEAIADYLRITTTGVKNVLEITGTHLIFLDGKSEPVRADSLSVGDGLIYNSLQNATSQRVLVTRIQKVRRRGLYQPLTKDGTVVVDGIHASAYVSIDHIAPRVVDTTLHITSEQNFFHWWMAPYRVVCTKVAPQLCADDYDKDEGFIHWLVLGRNLAAIFENSRLWS